MLVVALLPHFAHSFDTTFGGTRSSEDTCSFNDTRLLNSPPQQPKTWGALTALVATAPSALHIVLPLDFKVGIEERGAIVISDNSVVHIDGNGLSLVSKRGGALFQSTGSLSLVHMGLLNTTYDGGTGGAIENNGRLCVRGCWFQSNNGNPDPGGVIFNGIKAKLNVFNSSFIHNIADDEPNCVQWGRCALLPWQLWWSCLQCWVFSRL